MEQRRQESDEESDAVRAQAMIRANQEPSDHQSGDSQKITDKWCGKRKLLVLQLGRADGKTGRVDQELHGFGLGAAMHVLSVALSYGVRHNRTVLLPDRDSWWYTDPAVCKDRSFMCFFEPISPCSTGRHVGSESMQDLGEESERPKRGARARVIVAPTRLDKYLNHEDNRCLECPPAKSRADSYLIPIVRTQVVGSSGVRKARRLVVALTACQVIARNFGFAFLWVSLFFIIPGRYFFKPNSITRRALEAKAQALGLDESWGGDNRGEPESAAFSNFTCNTPSTSERVVGVHVRHGDKKTESAIIPIEQYLDAAKVGEAHDLPKS